MSTHSHTYLFQSNIPYFKKVSVSFGGWAAFFNSITYLNCREDITFVWQQSELGGYTPKGIYKQWVRWLITSVKIAGGQMLRHFNALYWYIPGMKCKVIRDQSISI